MLNFNSGHIFLGIYIMDIKKVNCNLSSFNLLLWLIDDYFNFLIELGYNKSLKILNTLMHRKIFFPWRHHYYIAIFNSLYNDHHQILIFKFCDIFIRHSTCVLSHVWFFVTPWTVAHQAPLPMEFSRQEYWSGLPFPSPGDLPNPWIEPGSPALQADSSPLSHQGSPS